MFKVRESVSLYGIEANWSLLINYSVYVKFFQIGEKSLWPLWTVRFQFYWLHYFGLFWDLFTDLTKNEIMKIIILYESMVHFSNRNWFLHLPAFKWRSSEAAIHNSYQIKMCTLRFIILKVEINYPNTH